MKIYRVYSRVNCADTCRDPDDISITELGYFQGEEKTKEFCLNHIKERFCQKDTKLDETKEGFVAMDFCSYGATLIAEEVEVQ